METVNALAIQISNRLMAEQYIIITLEKKIGLIWSTLMTTGNRITE
jgi:hypothetical protein